jgi:hypothetical protein
VDRNSLGQHFIIDSFEQGSIPSKPSKLKNVENHKVGPTAFLELFAGTVRLSEAM